MPIGSYEDWDECIKAQMKKGHSKESAERICGHIEQMTKRAHKAFSAGCTINLSDVYPDKRWEELSEQQKDHFRSLFAWVNGPKLEDCHLPYKDPKTGKVRLECVRAALAAIGGARTGKAMHVPQSVKTMLEKLLEGQ